MKAFLLITMTCLGGGLGCAPPDPKPVVSTPARTGSAGLVNQASSSFPELTGVQALEAHRTGTLFLDARTRLDYWHGHILGAENLPLWAEDFESRLLDFITGPWGDPASPVVIYCAGCCSTDSLFLARRLKEFGFSRIQIYRDGYPGWARAGWPTTGGNAPKVLERPR